MSETPVPAGQLAPLAMRFDIAPIGATAFVRFSFDHGIMSTTVCIPIDDVTKFGGDIKRMCYDAEATWKDHKRQGLIVPQQGLIVPGQN